MATINKPKHYSRASEHTVSGQIFKNIYSTARWRKMRAAKLMEQPLCECCLEHDIIKFATDVHHITEISTETDLDKQLALAYDFNNLMSLCETCHMRLHGSKHKKNNNRYEEE